MSTQVRSWPSSGLFTGLRCLPSSLRPPLLTETLPVELSENDAFRAFLSSFFASSPIADKVLDEFVRQMQKFPTLDVLFFESLARSHFPPKREWFRALLKRLIAKMDAFSLGPSDILYQSLCALMTFDSENDQDDSFFRIFPDFLCPDFSQASYILLKQRIQQISHGTTGLSCWTASSVLANFLTLLPQRAIFSSISHALELGAGCGLVGISFAASNAFAKVTLTDAHPAVLRQLRENVALNFDCTRNIGGRPTVSVEHLDWTDHDRQSLPKGVDLIIAADVIFDPSLFRPFAQLLRHFLCVKSSTDHVSALICCTIRDKGTVEHFLRVIEMALMGVKLHSFAQTVMEKLGALMKMIHPIAGFRQSFPFFCLAMPHFQWLFLNLIN